jgi:hypothetical protein
LLSSMDEYKLIRNDEVKKLIKVTMWVINKTMKDTR